MDKYIKCSDATAIFCKYCSASAICEVKEDCRVLKDFKGHETNAIDEALIEGCAYDVVKTIGEENRKLKNESQESWFDPIHMAQVSAVMEFAECLKHCLKEG